jgi:hypothetical protein
LLIIIAGLLLIRQAIYTDWKERKLPQQSIKAISVESAVKEILNQVAYLKQPDQYEY